MVEAELTRAAGFAERLAAVDLVAARAGPRLITVGADRAYDAADFVTELRELGATPHVAQNTAGRRSAIDRRTTRHPGYAASQRARHRIEDVFAWVKTIAGQSKTKYRGLDRVRWHCTLATAALQPDPPAQAARRPVVSRPQPGTDQPPRRQPSWPLLNFARPTFLRPSNRRNRPILQQPARAVETLCHFGIGKHTLSCREA